MAFKYLSTEKVAYYLLTFNWIFQLNKNMNCSVKYNLPEYVATMSGCNSFITPRRKLYSPAGLRHWKRIVKNKVCQELGQRRKRLKKLVTTTTITVSTKTIKRKCMIYYTDELTSPLGSSNLAWRNNCCMRTICCDVRDLTGILGLKSGPISPKI